jgi:hypothetical protein
MFMATRKTLWILFGILVISALVLGSPIQAGAETMNYKLYSYVVKDERVSIPDAEGHTVSLGVRKSFFVFENGEVATANQVATLDHIKRSGPVLVYTTITFLDGSLIIFKEQGTMGGTGGGVTGEIIKGKGRFEGAKGTRAVNVKYLPVEKDELGPKGYGEGTITFNLPTK